MSGIGPAGYSYSLNFARRLAAVKTGPAPTQRPGGKSCLVKIGWVLLRLVLGVEYGLIFELLGSFILTQTSWEAYDLRTHRRAEAIVYIGCIGGVAMGLILLLIDAVASSRRSFSDVEPGPPPNRPAGEPEIPNAKTARSQAVLRTLIWPGLGAVSGVVGILIWHLKENERPRPLAERRLATAAIIQAVGAAIAVSAPSVLQLLVLFGSGK